MDSRRSFARELKPLRFDSLGIRRLDGLAIFKHPNSSQLQPFGAALGELGAEPEFRLFRRFGPTGRGRSDSTKRAELRFCALLTEGSSRMIFYREGYGRLKDNLA